MIIDFTVENFLSFRDAQTLSFVAETSCKDHPEHLLDTPYPNMKLLKSVVIFGANASGKSNLLVALDYFKNLILKSITNITNKKLNIKPFLLRKENREKPTSFEINFFCNNVKYCYFVKLDNQKIYYESLSYFPKKYMKNIYIRKLINKTENETEYEYNLGKELKPKRIYQDIALKTANNVLFLSKAVQENCTFLKPIYDFFADILHNKMSKNNLVKTLQQDVEYKNTLLNFLKSQDININNVGVNKLTFFEKIKKNNGDFPSQVMKIIEKISNVSNENMFNRTYYEFITYHLDEDNDLVEFDFDYESEGTKRLFFLSAEIFKKKSGSESYFFYIDELDSALHPLLVKNFLKIFNTTMANQMVCVVHEVNILTYEDLRKDQICFVEKDKTQSSSIYYLSDFKVRSDVRENWMLRYLSGRYGATPYIQK